MGLNDALDSHDANFSKLSASPIYLSRVLQASKIIVNEEGTTAASFTAGVFANKATPPRFYCNRPFAFMVVEKSKNLILFMGLVRNPTSSK
jgi:serpin B